jgi:hypothetical protein
MDLNAILEELEKGTQRELQLAEDEDFKKFMKGAMAVSQARALPSRGSVSFGSYEEDLKALWGKDEVERQRERLREEEEDQPNKNRDVFAWMKNLPRNAVNSPPMSAPVRPQMWTGHKPSFERENELEEDTKFCKGVVFGPFPGDKSEYAVEQLKHLLIGAQANRAQADERTCKKPCRFLKESIRDSEVSGVPVGVRQRCSHPVFEQKTLYGLLALYAQILDVTEKFCESLVKANPEILDALPTARRIALAASQSLLITPRENNRDLIVGYLTDLDFMRNKVAAVIDDMKNNHALTVADDRYFTDEKHAADKERNC